MLAAFGGLYEDTLYMSNLFSFLAIAESAETRALTTGDRPPRVERDEKGVRFEDVGFRYPVPTKPRGRNNGKDASKPKKPEAEQ